ncbi:hypothetical protein [Curtobacterium sp. MCBD17_040]|uniref:hypothetical protein n=1 Tax=Curtobacterium sp. MCBD17_040 TaxID=2175674 RepID=UPI000DA97405|nr:hypothetical protein [Curtobacterium sp. MCBD17_040]WIB65311.1 hypothetical protein DEI94_18060 [Curtobacterium sp. MCBD17_040]
MSIDSSGNHHAPAGTPAGGQFAGHVRPEGQDVTLSTVAQLPEPVEVPFDAVQNGDEVLSDSGETWGYVVGTNITDGVRRVILHNGRRARLDASADTLTVRRRTEPVAYDPQSSDYWANVAAARDPRQSVEVLQQIVDTEAEDDLMLAIAEHPKATSEMLDRATRHTSLQVRAAALRRDHLWMETRWRMKREAEQHAADEEQRLRDEGVSPMAPIRRQSITAYRQHAAAVTESIARAGAWRDRS